MMFNWVDVGVLEPPRNMVLICYCPEWCALEYQVAEWNGREFNFPEQPNDMFSTLVVKWALIYEAN